VDLAEDSRATSPDSTEVSGTGPHPLFPTAPRPSETALLLLSASLPLTARSAAEASGEADAEAVEVPQALALGTEEVPPPLTSQPTRQLLIQGILKREVSVYC
jgi:hypothetical protein